MRSNDGIDWATILDTTDTVPLNTWTHIAGVYDGSDMIVYINGIESTRTSSTGTTFAGNAALLIGGGSDDIFFNGNIDEVMIWNRALTADEIKSHRLYGRDNVEWVQPNTGKRRWTYYKFDLEMKDQSYIIYYGDVSGALMKATVWAYVDQMRYLENGGWLPVDIDAQPVDNDGWAENALTWGAAQAIYSPTSENLDTKNAAWAPSENGDWIGFDVTRYVQSHLDTYQNGSADRYVSICLREGTGSPSLDRAVAFISENVKFGYRKYDAYGTAFPGALDYKPYLEVVYAQTGEAGYANRNLAEAGTIKFESQNEEFPKQTFIYEGGALILAQYYRNTMISTPDDFLTVTQLPGGLTKVEVTRYRIAGGGTFGGTGTGSLQLSVLENRWLEYSETPNKDKVTVTVRTDYRSAWSDYLEYRTDLLKHEFEPDNPDYEYSEVASFDYNRLAITIRGTDLGGATQDIVYCEKLVDIAVTVR